MTHDSRMRDSIPLDADMDLRGSTQSWRFRCDVNRLLTRQCDDDGPFDDMADLLEACYSFFLL
jgi:hypothetical protein